MFFAFDGVDGAGKTTQIARFVAWLEAQGHTVVACRDPGSTALGERIRQLLLTADGTSICRMSEMLLYMAARAQMVAEIIAPALEAGHVVVSDRYLLSNVVYQGHAGGLDVAQLWQLGALVTAGRRPDRTFVLDLSEEAAAARLNRPLDRMEQQGLAFRRALRAGFQSEAQRDPEHVVLIDAAQDVDAVAATIRAAAEPVLSCAASRSGAPS